MALETQGVPIPVTPSPSLTPIPARDDALTQCPVPLEVCVSEPLMYVTDSLQKALQVCTRTHGISAPHAHGTVLADLCGQVLGSASPLPHAEPTAQLFRSQSQPPSLIPTQEQRPMTIH